MSAHLVSGDTAFLELSLQHCICRPEGVVALAVGLDRVDERFGERFLRFAA